MVLSSALARRSAMCMLVILALSSITELTLIAPAASFQIVPAASHKHSFALAPSRRHTVTASVSARIPRRHISSSFSRSSSSRLFFDDQAGAGAGEFSAAFVNLPTTAAGADAAATALAPAVLDASGAGTAAAGAFDPATVSSALDVSSSAAAADPAELLQAATTASAAVATSSGNGGIGFLTEPITILLKFLHTAVLSFGITDNSWGISIVLLTVLIKLATYPLSYMQVRSNFVR
jgi:hypothetical protein